MSKIVVCHCNRPDFLAFQIDSYFKRCKDLTEIIVINDGSTLSLRQKIQDISQSSRVRCINTPLDLDHSSPPIACAAVLQWAYDFVLNEGDTDKFAFFDSDMFPIADFNCADYLQGEISFSALRQDRGHVDYPWNGIFFIDFSKIPHPRSINWYCGVVDCMNVDCGGLNHLYFQKYGRGHVQYLTHTSHMTTSQIKELKHCPSNIANSYNVDYKMEVIDQKFLHYGSASNWKNSWLSPVDFNQQKTKYMIDWLKAVGSLQ